MEDFQDTRHVDLNKILARADICAQVKMLALKAQKESYVLPGPYLKSLNMIDLFTYAQLAEMFDYSDEAAINLVSLTEILAASEGYPPTNPVEAKENVSYISTLLTSMMLEKKGIVKINYDAISFSKENTDVEVVVLKGANINKQI